MATLQTLQRGLRALEILASHPEGTSVAALARELSVDRAIAYRIVSTLEAGDYAARAADGLICLGVGVMDLASQFATQLGVLAQSDLQGLAEAANAAAFISIARGTECCNVAVAEPREKILRVAYRVGSRHPLTLGAAGIAILSARPESSDDADEIRLCRKNGYSITRGKLQQGAVGVACPIPPLAGKKLVLEASVGLVAMEDLQVELAARKVVAFAPKLSRFVSR